MQPAHPRTAGGGAPAGTPAAGRGVWSWLFAAALAGALLYFSLRGIEWNRVWKLLLAAHWRYVTFSALISAGTYFVRSLRWRLLLTASADFGVGIVFWANMAGYLANNFLPARAGELVRSMLISGRSGLTRTYVLTTALTERLADAIVLVFCGSVILLGVTPKPRWMDDVSRSFTLIAVLGLVFIAALPRIEGVLRGLLHRLPLPAALRRRADNVIRQVVSGVRVFHDFSRLAQFAALTAVIWAADAAGVMIASRAFDMRLTFPVALLLIVGLGLGSGLPSTPGYVGIYQFVAVSVLTPFGVGRNSAIAFIILSQASSYVLLLVLGSAGLWQLRRRAPAGAAGRAGA